MNRREIEKKGFFGERRYLSNFDETSFVYNKISYKTVEHAFQSLKSLDPKERKLVRESRTPNDSKKLGRNVTLRSDWEKIKFKLMESLVYEKFNQNENLKEKLLETGNEFLVEHNWWHDKIWGVCNGKGQNKLGQILMTVRERIRNES